MGKIFSISTDVKNIVQDAFDDLLAAGDLGGLGKYCRLHYPPVWNYCANCVYDVRGNKSSNRWLTGGPVPFPVGTACPMCNGAGRRAEEVTETVVFLIAWQPKDFFMPFPSQVQVPDGLIQVKGFVSPDLPKILRADTVVVDVTNENYLRQRYRKKGEPGIPGNIIQGRYFVANLERAGG